MARQVVRHASARVLLLPREQSEAEQAIGVSALPPTPVQKDLGRVKDLACSAYGEGLGGMPGRHGTRWRANRGYDSQRVRDGLIHVRGACLALYTGISAKRGRSMSPEEGGGPGIRALSPLSERHIEAKP